MRTMIFAILALFLCFIQPAQATQDTGRDPIATVEKADWLIDETVIVAYESGDTITYAPDLRTLLLSQQGPTSLASATGEACRVTWQSGAQTVEVVVVQKFGESDTAWAKRCADRVAAVQAVFPPNPPV